MTCDFGAPCFVRPVAYTFSLRERLTTQERGLWASSTCNYWLWIKSRPRVFLSPGCSVCGAFITYIHLMGFLFSHWLCTRPLYFPGLRNLGLAHKKEGTFDCPPCGPTLDNIIPLRERLSQSLTSTTGQDVRIPACAYGCKTVVC